MASQLQGTAFGTAVNVPAAGGVIATFPLINVGGGLETPPPPVIVTGDAAFTPGTGTTGLVVTLQVGATVVDTITLAAAAGVLINPGFTLVDNLPLASKPGGAVYTIVFTPTGASAAGTVGRIGCFAMTQ